jgi:hypothetical protein
MHLRKCSFLSSHICEGTDSIRHICISRACASSIAARALAGLPQRDMQSISREGTAA